MDCPAKAIKPLPNVINNTPAKRCTPQCLIGNFFQCPPRKDHTKKSKPATKFREKEITKGGKNSNRIRTLRKVLPQIRYRPPSANIVTSDMDSFLFILI
jgi:hypothetical protein